MNSHTLSVLSGAFVAVCCTFASVASAAEIPVKILPLGDSITYGYSTVNVSTPGGYREPLYRNLVAAGMDVEFLGSNTGNPGPLLLEANQVGHEGYPKYTIGEITANLDGSYNAPAAERKPYNNGGYWLTGTGSRPAIFPDATLLLIGTNDVEGGAQARMIKERLETLVEELFTLRPDTHLYLASLPPYLDDAARTEVIQEYNLYIETKIIPDFLERGYEVAFVNQYANFILPTGEVDPTKFGDRLHPNATAYEQMGATWAEALSGRSALAAVVPEPTSLSVLLLGSVSLIGCRRR